MPKNSLLVLGLMSGTSADGIEAALVRISGAPPRLKSKLEGHASLPIPKPIRAKILQIEQTVIGHLHSRLILWKSGLLAGMPPIHFLGHTVKRFSTALSQGRHWRPFHVKLCPSLAGIELLKDGGYCTVELDEAAHQPVRFRFHPLARNSIS